jgi:hypothetical protein
MLASGTWRLIAALLWLVLGVVVLVTDPPQFRFHFFGTPISSGWAALLLAAYNGVRWWGLRSDFVRRRAAEERERRRAPRRPPDASAPERNPDFIFDEPPSDKPG